MANELKITDIVDEKALKDVSSLNARLKNLAKTYSDLAAQMGVEIKVPVSDFSSLSAKAENYKNTLVSLQKTIEKMNDVQYLLEKSLKAISEKMDHLGKGGTIVNLFVKMADIIEKLTTAIEKLANKSVTVQQVTKTITKTVTNAVGSSRKLSEEIEQMSSHVFDATKTLLSFQGRLDALSLEMVEAKNAFERGETGVDEYTVKMDALRAEYDRVSAESERLRKAMTGEYTAMLKASGSYKEINGAMIKLRRLYKELSAEIRESPLGQDIGKTINSLNDELKRIDAGMGNYQRNVGNYSSAFNGLGYQVTQVVRELPALNSGFNTFMIAIGNNLPMLVDEIDRARKLNAQMAKDGAKTTPVWKQVTGAIFNWQTALVVGLTIITMYWKDISRFFKELVFGKKAYDGIAEAQERYNRAVSDGHRQASQESAELRVLYKASQDSNRTLEERIKAVDELKKRYPDYLGKFSQEDILAGKAASSYSILTQELVKAARAKAIMNEVTKMEEQLLKAEDDKARADARAKRYEAISRKGTSTETKVVTTLGALSPMTQEVATHASRVYNRAVKDGEEAQKKIEEINKGIANLMQRLDVGDIMSTDKDDGKDESKGFKSTVEKERDILEELIQTRIDLLEDARQRELAQNEKNYQSKMEGLEQESELYKNYTELMRRNEIEINKKYDDEAMKLLQEAADKEAAAIEDKYSMRALVSTKSLQDEIKSLSNLYAKGLIDAEEYEEKRTNMTNKYAIESANLGIEMIKEQLETENLSAEKRIELLQALQEAEIALSEAVITGNEEQAETRDKALSKAREGFEALRDVADESVKGMGALMDGIFSIFEAIEKGGKDTFAGILAGALEMVGGIKEMVSGMYDAQIEELEKEEEANEEAKQKELEKIDELAENGAISAEEAEARKRAAEDKTEAKNRELQKRKAELMTRQAKFEKAMNITQTIMATSLAVMKALPNVVLAGVVAAMGAVQLATIIAQPIPKYAKGTRDHKGGLAWVGDGGKHEGVITDKGLWVTPDKPTLVDLPIHSVVIPDISRFTESKGLRSDLLGRTPVGDKEPVVVNVNNDYKRLEREMLENKAELKRLTKVVKKLSRASEIRLLSGKL